MVPVIAAIFIVIFVFIIAALFTRPGRRGRSARAAAGRYGEEVSAAVIRSVLRPDDTLLNNVTVSFEGRRAELDNVVVNKYGVFIIEAKNYSGRLIGGEDDFSWRKLHTSRAGKTYVKEVKNPLRQVKRQVYILSRCLSRRGIRIWVEGYVYLVEKNSPVRSPYILSSAAAVDRAIHSPVRTRPVAQSVRSAITLLGG